MLHAVMNTKCRLQKMLYALALKTAYEGKIACINSK